MSCFSWFISIIFPYFTGMYIDSLVGLNEMKDVLSFTVLILLLGVFNIAVSYILGMIHMKIQTQSMIDLNFHVMGHLLKMPLRYFENKDSGYLNHRINNDSNIVISFVLSHVLNIVTHALTIMALVLICFRINTRLTLILFPLIPLYVLVYIFFKKPIYRSNYVLREKQNQFFSKMNQYLQNVNEIKVNATFDEARFTVENSFSVMFKAAVNQQKVSLFFDNSKSLISLMAKGFIFFIGGAEILKGNLTIGQFTIFNSYFFMVLGGVTYYLSLGGQYQSALVSYDRLNEILNESKETNGSNELARIEEIHLKNISFEYTENSPLIHTLNYKFKKNNIYCIVGDNGTGKSTLVKIILGIFNDYYKGEVDYNNQEIKKIDMYQMRKKRIGVSQQEPKLMNGTLLENITYGLENYNDEELEKIVSQLKLNFNFFKDGLETHISEESKNISGGEKQKINISRAALKNPDLLILDEPTSALDSNSVEELKSFIRSFKKNRIILIITHDYNLLEIANEVIDLNQCSYNDIRHRVV